MAFRAYYLRLFIIFLTWPVLHSQIPNGAWRDHLPYSRAKHIAEVEDKIFCSTNGGLFSVDKRDNNIQKYTKIEGLSDVEISVIEYDNSSKTLIIAYTNGNIDLIRNDSIINVPGIKLKLLQSEKIINSILISGNIAYLACGFGVVGLNIDKAEIKDSYLFGDNGSYIYVNDLASDGDYIYATTRQGIYKAYLQSPNLVDYSYWNRMDTISFYDNEFKSIVWYNNKLFTYYRNPSTNFDDIIVVDGENREVWQHDFNTYYKSISVHNGYLSVCSDYKNYFYNTAEERIGEVGVLYPMHGIIDSDNNLWTASNEDGLSKNQVSGGRSVYVPDGPAYRDVGHLSMTGRDLWVAAGNEASKYKRRGVYSFIDGKWESYNHNNFPILDSVLNISKIAIDPVQKNHILGGSNGYGIVEILDGEVINLFDHTNSILRNIEGYDKGYIWVNGLDFDDQGKLYAVVSNIEDPVYILHPDGKWENLSFDSDIFGFDNETGELLITSNGYKWLLATRKGIFIFDDSNDAIRERMITVSNQEGDIIDRLYSITEDLEGNIWVGTNKGPVVYYNPVSVLDDETITGYQVKIARKDDSGLADFLLDNEKINDIAIDGANRKWFATENSGVFLMSEDGKEEVHHFTSENSPLFSNNVLSISVDHTSGEVFFGTGKGLISFMGHATKGGNDFGNVYVYPNPVREDYHGDITVTELAANVNVKITDVSGNLVYETQALGGQAVWDGNNFAGDRVNTGVYLVFCSNDDGSKTFVTKLLFIH